MSNFVFEVTVTAEDETFALPLVSDGTYDFKVEWGDSSSDTITAYDQAEVTHTYSSADTYTVTIYESGIGEGNGTIQGWSFNNGGDKTKIGDISSWGPLAITGSGAFYGCVNLTCSATDAPTLSGNMSHMFRDCSSLITLNVSGVDTSNVTNMYCMFYGCSSLITLNMSGVDTSSVEDTQYMFYNCSSLITLNMSGVDTSNVTSMYSMFYNCSSLITLNMSGVDTSSVEDTRYMFYNCDGLASTLDVSGFDVSALTNADYMFGAVTWPTSFYDSLLDGWGAQTVQSGVALNIGSTKYTSNPPRLAGAVSFNAIGATHSTPESFADGAVSRLGAMNSLLTESEIAELYNDGKGRLYGALSSSLRAKTEHYYNTNEGPGETLYDAAGGNDGTPSLPTTNLVSNGDFETAGAGGADVFDDWTETTDGSSTINAEVGAGAYGGSGTSYRGDIDADGYGGSISQNILTSGHSYDLAYQAKATGGAGTKVTGDIDSDQIETSVTTSWAEYTGDFTATGTKFKIAKYGGASQSVYYDNISVVRTGPHVGAGQGPLGTDSQTGIVDGDTVTSWTDRSGHAHVASQSSAALKPIWDSDGAGRYPAALLDGEDDYLAIDDPIVSAYPFFVSVVGSIDTPTSNHVLLSIVDESEADVLYAVGVDGAGYATVFRQNAGSLDTLKDDVDISDGNNHIVTVGFLDADSCKLWVDGEYIGEDTTSIALAAGIDKCGIGAAVDASPAAYWPGRIAEPVIWNEDITDDLADWHYRQSKLYGITLRT